VIPIRPLPGAGWPAALALAGAARIGFPRHLRLGRLLPTDVNDRAGFFWMFCTLNKNDRPIYDLVLAINDQVVMVRMKDAMWKDDATGGEHFCDAPEPDRATLLAGAAAHEVGRVAMLRASFGGRTVAWPSSRTVSADRRSGFAETR
jgi:hypothetical protein